MNAEPDLSTIAALIGEPARAAILSALMGGQALPASELAYRAQITPQTASSHLHKLIEGGLLSVTTTGRHRYYRLKNAEVGHALEALAIIAPLPQRKSRHKSAEIQAMRFARTCYDHLAGRLGVAITEALLHQGILESKDDNFEVTSQGLQWLPTWGVGNETLHKSRRALARPCLDWSERRYHLAGVLGATIANKLFEWKWIVRVPEGRTIQLTEVGKEQLRRELGINLTSTPETEI
ncbi:MAG: helix-turn-helix transcriptional regulator [Chloroflexi bacterium]|nr:ArsR family transcriptional regulator [Chloroflexota bacterium]NOG65327.1 helix-turn-helix transcriptional regulator [Chloroflexota bacterium]